MVLSQEETLKFCFSFTAQHDFLNRNKWDQNRKFLKRFLIKTHHFHNDILFSDIHSFGRWYCELIMWQMLTLCLDIQCYLIACSSRCYWTISVWNSQSYLGMTSLNGIKNLKTKRKKKDLSALFEKTFGKLLLKKINPYCNFFFLRSVNIGIIYLYILTNIFILVVILTSFQPLHPPTFFRCVIILSKLLRILNWTLH